MISFTSSRSPLLLCLAALLLSVVSVEGVPSVAAQETRLGAELMRTNVDGYYYYSQPGEQTIQVTVSGAVTNPGLYEITTETDFGRVLALAGGPEVDPRARNVRRTIEVRLYRPAAGQIYATTYQDMAVNPNYPDLRDGDTLAIDVVQREGFRWQDIFSIAGGLTGVALLIDALANY